MSLPNIFEKEICNKIIARINTLNEASPALWGKMNAGQMLAHCNVTYEMAFTDKHKKAKGLKKWMLTKFVKKIVVNEVPYKKNSRTAPEFLVSDKQDFENEKQRLIQYINETAEKGAAYFEGKESNSFGKLHSQEWNNMFYKHLEHHLGQFGV